MKAALSIGLFVVLACAGACKKSESVPVGGECSSRDDCVNRNDCMKLPTGKSVCTTSCMPPSATGADSCPAPTKCKTVDMSMDTNGGKTVSAAGMHYCL